jgi:hypothetical protein
VKEQTYSAEFGSGLRATLTVNMRGMTCRWTPDLPRTLPEGDRAALLESYRTWRDDCLQDFARAHQLTVRTIRVDGLDCITFTQEAA